LVDGLIKLMDTPHHVTGPINLGNPDEFTILELAQKVIEMVGGSRELQSHPLPEDDSTQHRPVVEEAKRVLGWSQLVGLDEGLARTVEYFRSQLANQSVR
jgi:UDP-glucuronate decarboxylase